MNNLSLMAVLLSILLIAEMVSSAPASADEERIREIYELLRSGLIQPGFWRHQMERKGGRSPTLRLRFGRRSDPTWEDDHIPNSGLVDA